MASSKQGVALSIPWWHFLRWQYLQFGSGLLGFKAGIWFYSLIVIAVGIIIFFVLNDKEEAPSVEVKKRRRSIAKHQYDLGAERQNHLAYRF